MIVEYFKTADRKMIDSTLYFLVSTWGSRIVIQDSLRTDNYYYCEVGTDVCRRLYNRYRGEYATSYLYINKQDFDELTSKGYIFKKVEKGEYHNIFTFEEYVRGSVEKEWFGDLVDFGDIDINNDTLKKTISDTFEGCIVNEDNEHHCIYQKFVSQGRERLLYIYSYDCNDDSVHLYNFVTREYYHIKEAQDISKIYDTYIKPSLDTAFKELEPYKEHVLTFIRNYKYILDRCNHEHAFEIDDDGMFAVFKFNYSVINITTYFNKCSKTHLYLAGFEDCEVREIVQEFNRMNP